MRGSLAERIWPNVELVKFTVGMPRLTRFGTLNASARNSTDCFSRTWNARVRPISIRTLFGPRTLRGPIATYVPVRGCTNVAGVSHEAARWLAGYGSGRS